MAGDFLKLVGGEPADAKAIDVSAGAADGGKVIKTGADGKLAASLMPVGIAPETRAMTASEALSAGDLVNVWSSGGAKVRKADASAAGKQAHGYVLAAVAAGADVIVYTEEGVIGGLAGLTPGATYFLYAAAAGTATDTAPAGLGKVAQVVGHALSATELLFRPRAPITMAG